MRLDLKDLVLRLDESRGVLQFLVPKRIGGRDELRVFYEITDVECKQVESIEFELGLALMSFMSATYSSDVFGLACYRKAGKNFKNAHSDSLTLEEVSGNANAKYELALQAIAHGLRAKSKAKMIEADRLLNQAAKAGSPEAIDYLANFWPDLRMRAESFN